MTASDIAIYTGIALVGIFLSALYSGLETGVYTINRVRLTVRSSRGDPSAVRVRQQLRHRYRTLSVILIGTNASNYFGTYGLAGLLGGAGLEGWTLIAVEAALVTPVLFVFAETLPKDLFRSHTDSWTYRLSMFVSISRLVFTVTLVLPIVQLVSTISLRALRLHARGTATARQRISQLIREGVGAGVVSVDQATLTDRVLTLRDQRVRHVMVPWRQVVALPGGADRESREAVFRRRNFSRFPVVAEDGRVIGVLSWIDAVLEPSRPVTDLADPAISFPLGTQLLDALSRMRRERQSMAIVCEPHTERPVGIVTLKDLVEPLTGELAAW